MIVYADSSFLVSTYINDSHSAAVNELWLTNPRLVLTPLHRAEWAHAVAQHVFRHLISNADFGRLFREFEADRTAGIWTEVSFPDHALELSADLARQHGTELGVRTLDSLHVACALELKADRFWTFDQRQAKLAKAQGLRTS